MIKTTTYRPELLKSAIELHQRGDLKGAQRLYEEILLTNPDHFDALHFSGLIDKQTGHSANAIKKIGAALNTVKTGMNPGHASALCNLGAAYQDTSQPELAMEAYQKAIQLRPDYAIAHNNLGNALKNLGHYRQAYDSYTTAIHYRHDYPEAYYHASLVLQLTGQFEEALRYAEQALRLRPDYPEACCAKGVALHSLGQFDSAIDSYSQALALKANFAQAYFNRAISYNRVSQFQNAVCDFELAIRYQPNYPNAYFYLGNSQKQLNNPVLAIAAYNRAKELGADPDQVEFALATLDEAAIPSAAPPGYIKDLFDQYADHFDVHLTQVLQYKIPQLIAQMVAPHLTGQQLDCIDLGCGTGLCADFLRQHSATLTGIDLSQNMLDQAASLNLYDDLFCAEITDYLFQSKQQVDLIIAADVLVYLGDLQRLMQGVTMTLRDQGLFCFSVEKLKSDPPSSDYILQTSARYAHSEAYIRKLAPQHNLKLIQINQHSGRQENRTESDALIVLLQKVSGSPEM